MCEVFITAYGGVGGLFGFDFTSLFLMTARFWRADEKCQYCTLFMHHLKPT